MTSRHTGQSVYVILIIPKAGGPFVYGVYATPEKAKEARLEAKVYYVPKYHPDAEIRICNEPVMA